MTTKIEKLKWGLASAVPDHATSAWGARAIVDQLGHVDLSVPGRTDRAGSTRIFDLLDEQFPADVMISTVRQLLQSGDLDTRRGRFTVLYEKFDEPDLHVVADTRGSGGYLYVAAWTRAA